MWYGITMLKQRTTDPTKVTVQVNFKVPWDFREYLIAEAARQGVGASELIRTCLEKQYLRGMLEEQTRQS